MDNESDSSYETSTGDETSSTDDVIYYHPVGADATSSEAIWDSLTNMCKRSITLKFRTSKERISMDLDAFSFVISSERMNSDMKRSLREFLLSFGDMSFGRCSFPTMITGSNSKDSIFGCAGNESQHLPNILRGNEMLVIDIPVKIALHDSCQSRLIESLKSKGFYYSPSSTKTGVCFNPYAAANKPPYSVIVDAIIESCQVRQSGTLTSTNIIHVADMGFRSPLSNSYESISNLFQKCKTMEQMGFVVELTQFDVAFVIKTPEDYLIQATCKANEAHGKDSLFQKTQTTIYPIHKLQNLRNERLKNCDLKGTFEIKKTNWREGRNVIVDEEVHNSALQLFTSHDRQGNLRESISIHSSSLHSVKGYSTVAHSLLQTRSKYLMTDKAMYGVGYKKIQYIQTLIANSAISLEETFQIVKSHGIGFRIEVSIRPHFNDPIRYSRHGNDLLLITYLTLKELCGSKFSIRLSMLPTRSVETEAMKLLSEVTSMVRFRKDLCFNQVYPEEKTTEWLRSHLSLLLITIGICPAYSIKYVNQWLNDDKRFDPHNKVMVSTPSSRNVPLIFIQQRMLRQFENHLKYLKFSETAVVQLRNFLEKSPNVDPASCFSSLSLRNKHLLANCLWTDVIPRLSNFLSQDKNQVKSNANKLHEYDDINMEMEYEDVSEMLDPSITSCDKILNELMEKAPIPVHPLAIAITDLIRLSLLWNPNRIGYTQILLHFIAACHKNKDLGYTDISDKKSSDLISNCLTGTKLSRDDLRHICLHLLPSCPTRNQPVLSYQRMLCKHYRFPMSDISSSFIESNASSKIRNELINQSLTMDLSVVIHQDRGKTTFHRISENSSVEIVSQNCVLCSTNNTEVSTSFQHHNIYIVMARVLHSKSETCLRQMLHDKINNSKRNLKNIFLTSAGTTSKYFKGMNTLNDLQIEHQFCLQKQQDTIQNLVKSARFEPEIVLSLINYVYQKNIIFHNAVNNTTCFYMYWKSRSVKYQIRGCNHFPVINSIIIRQDDSHDFKFQELSEPIINSLRIPNDASGLFSLAPIGGRVSSDIRLNVLSNCRRTSSGLHFYSAISKLLYAIDGRYLENSDHGNWISDPLGLKSFMLEISRSETKQHQCFHNHVTEQCELLRLPLRILAHHLLQDDFDQTSHKLLCPMLCLKNHNLLIGVFDSGEKEKLTYFYAFNPFPIWLK